MFFSKDILTRKEGGLAVIWLAATLGTKNETKRLSKKDYEHVDVPEVW